MALITSTNIIITMLPKNRGLDAGLLILPASSVMLVSACRVISQESAMNIDQK